jgi:hypothetical protein
VSRLISRVRYRRFLPTTISTAATVKACFSSTSRRVFHISVLKSVRDWSRQSADHQLSALGCMGGPTALCYVVLSFFSLTLPCVTSFVSHGLLRHASACTAVTMARCSILPGSFFMR